MPDFRGETRSAPRLDSWPQRFGVHWPAMSLSTLTVAALQLSSQDDVDANLTQCRHGVERAVRAGAQLIVLPENFAYVGPDPAGVRAGEPLSPAAPDPRNAPIQTALA